MPDIFITGNEDPFSLLRDIIEAEEIKLDRWTVVFRPLSEETTEGIDGKLMVSTTQATEDNAQASDDLIVTNSLVELIGPGFICMGCVFKFFKKFIF